MHPGIGAIGSVAIGISKVFETTNNICIAHIVILLHAAGPRSLPILFVSHNMSTVSIILVGTQAVPRLVGVGKERIILIGSWYLPEKAALVTRATEDYYAGGISAINDISTHLHDLT